jgi:putative addiction module component (TIGR02574 family)
MAKSIAQTPASKLSVAERILLVEELWDSIADEPEAVPLTPSQAAELDRRLRRYRRSRTSGASWEQVKARLGSS